MCYNQPLSCRLAAGGQPGGTGCAAAAKETQTPAA